MSSVLIGVQRQIADRLLADPFFAAIPVLIEQPRDAAYAVQQSVAARGVSVHVLVPVAHVLAPNAPGPIFDPVEIVLRIRENVPVAPGPHALEIAETALALLHLYRPPALQEIFTAAPHALQRVEERDCVSYEVRVLTSIAALYPVPQLAAPTLGLSTIANFTTATLASPQPGAAIFYSLDGSNPAPRAPTAVAYVTPFLVPPQTTLRARAWLAGYSASPETIAFIP